jgi:asparaginyl-tRNA synthetase
MNPPTLSEIFTNSERFLNSSLEVQGWVRTLRTAKEMAFIELNDGTYFGNLQVVAEASLPDFTEITKIPLGAALRIQGQLVSSPAKGQAVELQAEQISIIGNSQLDYPMQKKKHSFEFLRTIAHLRPRANTFLAVFRIRSLLAYAIHRFLQEHNFVYVHTPIITASDAEGAGQLFRVTTLDLDHLPQTAAGKTDYSADFFGRESFLTVSGQLEVETFCMAFQRVYTFGPTFRAENSNTPRHASEFWMIEPEIAFADLGDDMKLAEDMFKYIIRYILDNAKPEMAFLNRHVNTTLIQRLERVAGAKFAHITYTEAVERLQRSGKKFVFAPEWGKDLQTEHERYLSEEVFQSPLFVTDYPKQIKAFYMRLNDDQKTVAAMDLLVPEVGEIIGGSQREERLDVLERRIGECGLNPQNYWWYLELRKYGGTPHAGFGLGFERALMYLTGMENIRDVLPFPRTPKSAEF